MKKILFKILSWIATVLIIAFLDFNLHTFPAMTIMGGVIILKPKITEDKMSKEAFNIHKKQAIKAAKELHYDIKFTDKLKRAKTDCEIDRIMATAREEKFDDTKRRK